MRKLRGIKTLIHDAVDATTYLVREGHESVARSALRFTSLVGVEGDAPARIDHARRLGTDGVLATVRGVNHLVGALSDAALDRFMDEAAISAPPIPMRSDITGDKAWVADAALGALNGLVGDHLASSDNALDMGMCARLYDLYWDEDTPIELADASHDLVILVHGLSATEWSWCLGAEQAWDDPAAHFGALLERDADVNAIYIRYNSGRSVQTNGAALAALLERLVAAWPVPVHTLTLIGHSMGGLVSRSACHEANLAGQAWPSLLRLVASLGTPHQGAPLARLGDLVTSGLGSVDLPATRIISAILARRSAGIHDLSTGELLADTSLDPDADADPERRVVPLLDHVRYAFIASTITQAADHPVGALLGDLLVRVESASGPRVQHTTFPIHTAHLGGLAHHHLQVAPAVYHQLLALIPHVAP